MGSGEEPYLTLQCHQSPSILRARRAIGKKMKKSIRHLRAETHTDTTHESQQQNYSQTMPVASRTTGTKFKQFPGLLWWSSEDTPRTF